MQLTHYTRNTCTSRLLDRLTTAGEDVRVGGVHSDSSDVVGVRLKRADLLQGVVVEYSHLHVV